MFETESLSCLFKDINEPSQDKNETIVTKYGSCKFVNTPLPCINKAIHHLQELELKMEKCFQQYDNVFKEKMHWVTEQVSAECIKDIWVSISTELDYKDADVSCEDGKTLTLKQETEALLLEVTELIKRLEADCEEAKKALELEKQRRKKLSMKIDQMSLWRLQQLPAAVQKEYDMCVQDILELQHNIDCKSHHLQQVQNQILKLETANRKIQEDIDFMKKHSPLLEEKLNLEEKAVNDVLLAYEKISKTYSDIHYELMKVQETLKSIEKESEQKIKSMCEKVKYAEMKLSQYKNELKHSEFIWTEYCMKLKETEEKIIKDEKHLEELVKQKAEIQEDAKCWNSKIEDLISKINIQGEESIKMSNASSEVIKALEELKSMRESYLQNIKQKLLNMNKALVVLKRENKELEGENEELLQKITTSSVKKVYQSEVETTCKSISNMEQQLERANEDLCNTELSYSEKCRKYEDLKESQAAEEMSYKKSEQHFNKEIEHQKGVWKAIQSRIKAIYDELEEKKKEKIKKTKEDMKSIEERERQVADLETKLKRHKAVFKDNCKKLSHLDQNIQELEKQQKQTEQQLEQSISILQQQLNDIQEKVLFTSSQIDENSHTMENFKKELQELNELWNIMQIQMENTEKSFAALGQNLSAVMFKQQSTKKVFDRLQHELEEYEKKVKKEEKNHGELLQIRKKNLKDSEAALEQINKENLCLAQEYQIFQNYYLNSKQDLSKLYANRIRAETATKDHQQIWALQRQLRGVLDEQRSQGGPSIPPGLARIQAASQENAQKILAAQGELSKAIQHVTAFLHSLTDGSLTADNNANNQCVLDAQIKDKKSHTVQITV